MIILKNLKKRNRKEVINLSIKEIFNKVDEKEDRLIEIFRNVIAVDTTVPPGLNYDKLVEYLESEFRKLEFSCERVLVPEEEWKQIPYPLKGDRINLVAKQGNTGNPLSIYAHMDVVPIEEGWDVNPFAGIVKDDKIYGRGASDMKGSIASLLLALDVIKELNLVPQYDLNCLLCTDEEIGMYPGVYYLARKGYIPEGPIICMEGMQDPLDWLASAGCVDVSIKVKGKSCHSGMNFLGVNAIEESIPILNELMNLKKEVEKRESEVPGAGIMMPNAPSNKMTPMFNIDIINAGNKSNIVPSLCTIIINRRYIPEEKYEDIIEEIKNAVEIGKKNSKALDVTLNFSHIYPAIKVNASSPNALKMKEAVKLVQGYKDENFIAMGLSGSTDMAFVQMVTGNEDIIFRGTGRSDTCFHAKNEFVYLKDLKALAKELIYFIIK